MRTELGGIDGTASLRFSYGTGVLAAGVQMHMNLLECIAWTERQPIRYLPICKSFHPVRLTEHQIFIHYGYDDMRRDCLTLEKGHTGFVLIMCEYRS